MRSAGLHVLWAFLRYVNLKSLAAERACKWNSYEPGSDYHRTKYSGRKNARSTDEEIRRMWLANDHILISRFALCSYAVASVSDSNICRRRRCSGSCVVVVGDEAAVWGVYLCFLDVSLGACFLLYQKGAAHLSGCWP